MTKLKLDMNHLKNFVANVKITGFNRSAPHHANAFLSFIKPDRVDQTLHVDNDYTAGDEFITLVVEYISNLKPNKILGMDEMKYNRDFIFSLKDKQNLLRATNYAMLYRYDPDDVPLFVTTKTMREQTIETLCTIHALTNTFGPYRVRWRSISYIRTSKEFAEIHA